MFGLVTKEPFCGSYANVAGQMLIDVPAMAGDRSDEPLQLQPMQIQMTK